MTQLQQQKIHKYCDVQECRGSLRADASGNPETNAPQHSAPTHPALPSKLSGTSSSAFAGFPAAQQLSAFATPSEGTKQSYGGCAAQRLAVLAMYCSQTKSAGAQRGNRNAKICQSNSNLLKQSGQIEF